MEISFAQKGSWKQDLIQAYSFRLTDTPDFIQKENHITTCARPYPLKGYNNISLLSKDTYGIGVCATMHFSFTDVGCAEIILVPELESCEDGVMRYGPHFEVVPWKNGLNVWRHYREDGRCFWHQRLGLDFPVEEETQHKLSVKILENYLSITLDGKNVLLRTEDISKKFHVGICGCEGIARLYDLNIEA